MSNVYELRTLGDVFGKVPPDRIMACLTELAEAMERTHRLRDVWAKLEKSITGESCVDLGWPEAVTWADDGEGRLSIVVRDESGDDLLVVEYGAAAA